MSDREEFEKWYTRNFGRRATEFGYETDICWQAWQAARAQGGEGEPVAWSLRWPEDEVVNAMTTFDTEDQARRYADACQDDVVVVPLYTNQPKQQGGVPDGNLFEVLHEAVASMPKGIAEDDNDTPTEHILRAIKPFLSTPPADKPEGEWVKLSDNQPREIDVDVRLRDGSVIRGCLAQSDGDFYWKGGGSEMFILEHEVVEWRSAAPDMGVKE